MVWYLEDVGSSGQWEEPVALLLAFPMPGPLGGVGSRVLPPSTTRVWRGRRS